MDGQQCFTIPKLYYLRKNKKRHIHFSVTFKAESGTSVSLKNAKVKRKSGTQEMYEVLLHT